MAALRTQRNHLRGVGAEDCRASDSGDRAEALRRADDVFRIEDRINEISRLLTVRPSLRAPGPQASALDEGSTVTLRFPDGDEETFYVSSILGHPPAESQVEILGLDSPLASALAGHGAGDRVRWATTTGASHADVVKIQQPPPTTR